MQMKMSAKFLVLVYLVAVVFQASAVAEQTKSLHRTHQDDEWQPERFVRCEQTSRDGDGFCTKAMDGLHASCGARESTSQAEAIKHSAWTGFFGSERLVKQVRIVGRNFNNGLRNFRIVLDGDKVCYEHNSTKEIQDETFHCEGKSQSVRIELMSVANSSLCEVIAYTNRHFYPRIEFKSCAQSSTRRSIRVHDGYECELAMDNKYSVCSSHETYSSTFKENMAWWIGTFNREYNVEQVAVVGSIEAENVNELSNFVVILDNRNVCAEDKSQEPSQRRSYVCTGLSKTVEIVMKKWEYLKLCEVLAYGTPKIPDENTVEYKPVEFDDGCAQSTEFTTPHKCTHAIDGNYSNCGTHYTHTAKEHQPHWSGYFAQEINITKVRIIGRKNAISINRLRNFDIHLENGVCNSSTNAKAIQDKVFDCVGLTDSVKIQLRDTNYLSLCEVIPYRRKTVEEMKYDMKYPPPKCRTGYEFYAPSKKCYKFIQSVEKYKYDTQQRNCKWHGGRIIEPRNWVTINYIKEHHSLQRSRYACYFIGVTLTYIHGSKNKFVYDSHPEIPFTIENWASRSIWRRISDNGISNLVIMFVTDKERGAYGRFAEVYRDTGTCYGLCESDPLVTSEL